MSRPKTTITILAMLMYGAFLALAFSSDLAKYYGIDTLFFALFTLFLHFTFRFWRLNIPVYTLIVLSFALHLMGIFGWYNVSPIVLPWDHVTHGIPLFTFTVFLFNYARQWMGQRFWNTKTWAALVIVFLAGLGVGALVENTEFAGFLTLGYGEGGLFLGGPGDGLPLNATVMSDIQEIGGGYLNTEYDLVWNGFGAVAALLLMSIIHFGLKKRAPSGTA